MVRINRRTPGKIIIRVPATTANLGPGFDTLGMALSLYNTIELELTGDKKGLIIDIEGEGADRLPRDETNAVWQAASRFFEKAGFSPPGIRLNLINCIPTARGLGSSAAARIGGLLAANSLLQNRFTLEEILNTANMLEGHPDNVAAALMGGIVAAGVCDDRIIWRRLSIPLGLKTVVAVPDFELSTAVSCSVLPQQVSMRDAVYNIRRACLLCLALADGDLDSLGELMNDRLHQPYREPLIPGLKAVFAAAREAGALGAALSGAGPTVIALTRGNRDEVGEAMRSTFASYGVSSVIMHLSPVDRGAELVEQSDQ